MKYLVTTSSSVYCIDTERGWIVREPLADPLPDFLAMALRGDTERIKLIDLGPITVGEPMVLALRIVEGILTIRQTTPVTRVETVDTPLPAQ